MAKNIFLELELCLDPPITEEGAMKEQLEKVKIPDWMKQQTNDSKYKVFVAKARKYIEEGLPQLEQRAKEARDAKLEELKKQAKKIIEIGATERHVKNLVNDFKKFFHEDTIKKLVPLENSSSNQSDDEFQKPDCPDSLKCGKPVKYADMLKISYDLDVATDGKDDSLYKLLKVNEREKTVDILSKAKAKNKEIHDMPKTDIKADPSNRLAGQFMQIFKDDDERKKYDVALKRFPFDKEANTTLKLYVDGWKTRKKTDWEQYHNCIDEVKKLGYTQEEAAYLVYEYFCITQNCPLPVKPKKGVGWGKHEGLHAQLIFLLTQSIKYHETNPRIKNKLQSVIEQFNEITDPDSVESTVKRIINDDLRKFWESCKYDGISSNDLFMPTVLANFPNLQGLLNNFTLNN